MSKVKWKNWNPQGLKDRVKGDLAENMEIACKFVETMARTRLLAIRAPEWGASYRRNVVARRLTYVVKVEGNEVVGTVGVRAAEGKDTGLWIELGTATVPPRGDQRGRPGYPAHPYLRPAVFNHAKEIVQLLGGN